jgi:hypothetical protein
VRLFEYETGRSFQINYVPEEALRGQKAAAHDPLQESFAAMMLTYAAGAQVPMQNTLMEFPVRLQSIKDYCTRLMGEALAF